MLENKQKLSITCSDISGSNFDDVNARGLQFNNINLSGTRISDADLSDLEIDGAQMGGAYIHNIGMPPECHPLHDPNNMRQKPIRFENCDLNGSSVKNSDLSGVEITNCDLTGMKINGILVEDLLKLFNDTNK